MFDYLYSEEWWDMVLSEAIITAIITTVGTIIVAIIGGYFACKFPIRQNSDANTYISDKVHELSKEHNRIVDVVYKGNESIVDVNKEIRSKVENVSNMLIEEKAKEEMRYESLSKSQLDMINVADKISAMSQELQRQALEISEQKEKNLDQERKLAIQNETIKALEEKNKALEIENKKDKATIKELEQKIGLKERFKDRGMEM